MHRTGAFAFAGSISGQPDAADCARQYQSVKFPQKIAADLPSATVIPTAQSDLMVCHEVENLDVCRVAARLVEGRRDYVEIPAKRLHTRVDVTWSEMPLS